ncbi:hypothetical protein M2334_000451 [Sphingobium sp. B11D3D]|nr:hypothetical protein [Sphingobium sp. B11D3D]
MTTNRIKVWLALAALPLAIAPIVLLATGLWLRTHDAKTLGLIAVAGPGYALAYATFITHHWQRKADEVERASIGFSVKWGMWVGTVAFILLLMVPIFQNMAASFVWNFMSVPRPAVGEKIVVLAMTLGLCGVVLLQSIGTLIMSAVWWSRKR